MASNQLAASGSSSFHLASLSVHTIHLRNFQACQGLGSPRQAARGLPSPQLLAPKTPLLSSPLLLFLDSSLQPPPAAVFPLH